jgi:competence protein ComEA
LAHCAPTPIRAPARLLAHAWSWTLSVRRAGVAPYRIHFKENHMSRKLMTSALALLMGMAFSMTALAATPVNVNKADATTIAKALDGVGMTKARAIVAYRDEHGPFKSVAELANVKGIGPATLAHNKDDIRLSGASAKAATKAEKKSSDSDD